MWSSTGEGITAWYFRFSLNKREYVVYKFISNIVAIFGYPLERNLFFVVCNTVERQQYRLAGIQPQIILAFERDHLPRSAADCSFDCVFANAIGFLNVHCRSYVSRAAL